MAAIEQDVEQYPDGSTRLEESKDKDEETHELSEEDLEKTAKDFAEYLIVNSKQEVGELYPWTMTSPFSASPYIEASTWREDSKYRVSCRRVSTTAGVDASKRYEYLRESLWAPHAHS